MMDGSKKLIDLDLIKLPLPKVMDRQARSVIENLLGVSTLNQYYRELEVDGDFYHSTLSKLGIAYQMDLQDPIPLTGGVVVVANHPYGAVEGVVLGAWLSKHRPDFKFMGNGLLQMIDEMKDDVIAVNPFGHKSSVGGNASGLREAIRWVQQGHVLVVFPAGEVSSLRLRHMKVEDPQWSKHIGWLIKKTEASVLPLFLHGRNGALFQSLGLLHPLLRTLRLPKELLNKSGQTIRGQAGRLILNKHYKSIDDPQILIDYFRHQTYALNRGVDSGKDEFGGSKNAVQSDIVEGPPQSVMENELLVLEPGAKILERGKFAVYVSKMQNIPHIMKEIGRMREVTFRAVGEGTGKAIDVDQYDPYYQHLFLWDHEAQQLVGAYRIGHTKQILDQFGPQGMYSNSLFKIKKQHWETLSQGLEMGRSFIRQEYQKSPMCLPLLWQGICKYLLRNPDYSSLYGCVSICSEYQKSSVDLMIDYLKKFRPAPDSVSEVKPRTKHRQRQRHMREWLKGLDPSQMNPEQLSQMISMIEPDGKGIPVLLRHYLKAGSKILCFNVDPDFSDVVDALIIVNLYETDSKLIGSFLKRSEVEKFEPSDADTNRDLA